MITAGFLRLAGNHADHRKVDGGAGGDHALCLEKRCRAGSLRAKLVIMGAAPGKAKG
jgi:hypothetical protein